MSEDRVTRDGTDRGPTTEAAAPSPSSGGADAPALEGLIATVLRVGVGLALLVVAVGGIVAAFRHPGYLTSPEEYRRLIHPTASSPRTLEEILRGLVHLDGRALVMLGVLILLATPVVRVAISVVLFARRREPSFAVMAVVVLGILALSFLLGRAG